jgi:hypothetical protein
MPLHLIKLAVGVGDLAELRKLQKLRRKQRGFYCFYTRNMPRQHKEILDGGSIYWVIRGQVQARQRIIGFLPIVNKEGERRHLVKYQATIFPTYLQPRRAFQGWRYLLDKDAPPDRPKGMAAAKGMPPRMVAELRELGLL